jgi:prevent-host-death family protein
MLPIGRRGGRKRTGFGSNWPELDLVQWTKENETMAYTVHQAKTNFSRILREVEAGKEVIVTRGKKPVARITAVDPPAGDVKLPFRLLGAFPEISWAPDAFAPLSDQELREMGLDDLADAPLISAPGKPSEEK